MIRRFHDRLIFIMGMFIPAPAAFILKRDPPSYWIMSRGQADKRICLSVIVIILGRFDEQEEKWAFHVVPMLLVIPVQYIMLLSKKIGSVLHGQKLIDVTYI